MEGGIYIRFFEKEKKKKQRKILKKYNSKNRGEIDTFLILFVYFENCIGRGTGKT